MPPAPTSRLPSLLSPHPPTPTRSGGGSLRSRLGWERKPGCWLACRREEVEEEESLALPTLSPRLNWRRHEEEKEKRRVAELWFRRRWRLSVTGLALHHLQTGFRLDGIRPLATSTKWKPESSHTTINYQDIRHEQDNGLKPRRTAMPR
ncbi:hypothetical protein EYF80_039241 [Liparis tanakae]|uniref:Uncharacterized protein n=1 Tax=Liparis tanakae TaxID=230148 RepID=A0A4Z2GAX2_9TELE|nr:hypothetical protein EYF80_039241 [Liparis tanakae]